MIDDRFDEDDETPLTTYERIVLWVLAAIVVWQFFHWPIDGGGNP